MFFMFRQEENELKLENEDLYSSNMDTKCSSQKIGKYIDTDPYSYISDLIIQISKNITNGRGLSQNGVNSLFLFILTGGLLYNYTVFPQSISQFLKLYLVSLLFLFYFIIDILKNIPFINNLFMRIFKRSDFAYCAIISDSISIYDLENCLEYKAFSSQQLIDIVEHLINKEQLSPKSQAKLMLNTSVYEIESVTYMKELVLKYEFTAHAICIFLRKMSRRLDYKYLDKLIEKYGKSPSVLFSVGKFHNYKVDGSNSLIKLGYEFNFKRKPYFQIYFTSLIFSLLLSIILLFQFIKILLNFILFTSQGLYEEFLSTILKSQFLILFCIMCIMTFFISPWLGNLYQMQTKTALNKYLLNKKNMDKDIIDEIIINLDTK
jgi:hypothetical protein